MSKNIDQVYIANPITSNATTDLMYFGQSPYSTGDDAAMNVGDFSSQFRNQAFSFGNTVTTSPNVYTLSLTPPLTSLQNGQLISFIADSTNTGNSTLAVDGTAATNILVVSSDSGLNSSVIQNGKYYEVVYNSGNWIILNPSILIQSGQVLIGDTVSSIPTSYLPFSFDPVNNALKMGPSCSTNGNANCVSMGNGSQCQGSNTFVFGISCQATGDGSAVFGNGSAVNLASSYAFGLNHSVSGSYSCAIGSSNTVNGNYSYGLGVNGISSADYCVTIGNGAVANNTGSAVWGDSNPAPIQDNAANQWVQTFANGYYWYLSNTPTLAAFIDASGNFVHALGAGDQSKLILTPSTGDTITLSSTNKITIINPSGTLATLTINFPSSYINGQIITISFTQAITGLSLIATATIVYNPVAAAAGQVFSFIYDQSTLSWYPYG